MFTGSIGTTRRARRGMLREWRLHALSIFSLAVAFVCLGAALLVLTNLHAVEERWSHAGRASIYLKDSATQQDVDAFKIALASVPGVTQVRYVSSGQARSEFGREELAKAADLAALPVEAFPASIEIDVRPDMLDTELEDMVGKLRQLPAVDDVETYQTWTERLARLVRGGVAAAALLAFVVFASVLAVIGSTMRLALQRRKTEVEVLRLVGATDAFVKGPFLIEGSAQGALGAIGALALLGALFLVVRGRLDGELAALIGVDPTFLPWPVVLGMIGVGAFLGMTAAALGLRKLVAV
jgi:cell division transport system permease protein